MHSNDVFIELFKEQLHHREAMPFVEFMHHALYAPHVGYYHQTTLGKRGDFTTAPELTPLFGYTLANQCAALLPELNQPILFEFGAGSGRLCVDLLTALKERDRLPEAYYILDVSSSLKQQQQAFIHQHIPDLADRVQWLSHWPQTPFEGIIIANEVLDAMPVHRFLKTEEGLQESVIKLNADGAFTEQFIPCKNRLLQQHVERVLASHNIMPYCSEVNLFIDDWLNQCSQMLTKGAMIMIDYGFPQHEYYHPDRHQGTLMCHAQHRAHTAFCEAPGQHDITAHVDFTHVAEAAHQAGFHVAGYTNQASFLIANGLLDCLVSLEQQEASEQQPISLLKAQQAVKQLIQPHEMGELFKVIALTKNLDVSLDGFRLHDKRASL